MVSDKSSLPEWTKSPPSLFDIVTGFYPETKPRDDGPAHRPCLVTRVLRNKKTGEFACEVAYGTKTLKTWLRHDKDIVIQNNSDLDEMGLPHATRFVLDPESRVILPWRPPPFECWNGYRTPKIGFLTLDYQKDFAWITMRQMGQ